MNNTNPFFVFFSFGEELKYRGSTLQLAFTASKKRLGQHVICCAFHSIILLLIFPVFLFHLTTICHWLIFETEDLGTFLILQLSLFPCNKRSGGRNEKQGCPLTHSKCYLCKNFFFCNNSIHFGFTWDCQLCCSPRNLFLVAFLVCATLADVKTSPSRD